jgi:putative ABC transport system substrate-binding protein
VNNRRKLLVAISAGALVAPFASMAQQQGKSVRVALFMRTNPDTDPSSKVFVDTMRELGWVEGRNIIYDRIFTGDDPSRLSSLAAAMVNRGPDLIFAHQSSPTDAAIAATHTIPIVLGSQSDWVERGLAKSLARPGGNVTGVMNLGSDLGAKRLQLLNQVLPHVSRVGVLVNSIRPNELKLIERASSGLHVTIVSAVLKQPSELDAALASFGKSRIEALLTTHNDLFLSEGGRIVDFAARQRIPVIAHRSRIAEDGALLSYSSVLSEQISRAAHMADKILKGTKPGDIPVELPTKFEMTINMKTAKALGIKFPNSILVQVTKVIE